MNLISLSQKGFISNGNWDMGKKLGIQIVKLRVNVKRQASQKELNLTLRKGL